MDVGRSGSKDYLVLQALLLLTKPVSYTVAEGDNLDFIIRKQFLVSEKYKNAYSLYLQRIIDLNQDKHLTAASLLRVGLALRVPGGPQYGGIELGTEAMPPPLQDFTFNALSKTAYSIGVVTAAKIQNFSTESLGAYVSRRGEEPASDPKQREALFAAIKSRGLVRAIDETKAPEARLSQTQSWDLTITDAASQAALDTLVRSDPENVLPGLFPVSESTSASCVASQPCTSCAAGLGITGTIDLGRARVLIEDTGVALNLVASDRLILQASGDNGQDKSTNSHGTFVYSQIAASVAPLGAFGAIPKENVYVAKVVRDVNGKEYFSMSDIIRGWSQFSSLMDKDSRAARTRVVNLSAFGEPVPDPDHPPAIPNDGHLLIVAAAGNDGREDEPALWAFDRLSGGSAALLITGALGTDKNPTGYSNWNSTYVQLFAPGDCVCGAPGQINGTSQAAPFVTTAAAALASANPDWDPLSVMWRLISTADRRPELQRKAFGGAVNLGRALDRSIIAVENRAGAQPIVHHASSVEYDASWKAAFSAQGINVPSKETLRLYSPVPGSKPNETCFTSMQMFYPTTSQLCLRSDSKIEIVEGGTSMVLSAAQISDLVLPVPVARSDDLGLPDVSVPDQ